MQTKDEIEGDRTMPWPDRIRGNGPYVVGVCGGTLVFPQSNECEQFDSHSNALRAYARTLENEANHAGWLEDLIGKIRWEHAARREAALARAQADEWDAAPLGPSQDDGCRCNIGTGEVCQYHQDIEDNVDGDGHRGVMRDEDYDGSPL